MSKHNDFGKLMKSIKDSPPFQLQPPKQNNNPPKKTLFSNG